MKTVVKVSRGVSEIENNGGRLTLKVKIVWFSVSGYIGTNTNYKKEMPEM